MYIPSSNCGQKAKISLTQAGQPDQIEAAAEAVEVVGVVELLEVELLDVELLEAGAVEVDTPQPRSQQRWAYLESQLLVALVHYNRNCGIKRCILDDF